MLAQVGKALAVLALLGWSAGFAEFTLRAMRPVTALLPQADGIVVLTGGANRIDAALSLLKQHRARLMLISGVKPGLDLAAVLHASGPAAPEERRLAGRVTLGHAATSTIGNARETADWAHAHAVHSLIVVTASYHMRRAILVIGSALPDAALLPYPVLPPALQRPLSLGTLRLLVVEYNKWLLVASGLAGRVPRTGAKARPVPKETA